MSPRPVPRPSASAPWWIAGGLIALLLAVVLFAVTAATVEGVVAEAVTGDQAIAPLWPLLGLLVLGAAGVGSIAHGRRLQILDRLHAARVERMRRALHDPADAGLSPGIAGTPLPGGPIRAS